MEFGVWKYMFSNVVYALMGQSLLHIFPNKPTSTRQHRYDNSYIFQELDYINKLRNRIAHHEPICFSRPNAAIDTSYVCSKPVCSHDATFQLDGYRWCFINVWT